MNISFSRARNFVHYHNPSNLKVPVRSNYSISIYWISIKSAIASLTVFVTMRQYK